MILVLQKLSPAPLPLLDGSIEPASFSKEIIAFYRTRSTTLGSQLDFRLPVLARSNQKLVEEGSWNSPPADCSIAEQLQGGFKVDTRSCRAASPTSMLQTSASKPPRPPVEELQASWPPVLSSWSKASR